MLINEVYNKILNGERNFSIESQSRERDRVYVAIERGHALMIYSGEYSKYHFEDKLELSAVFLGNSKMLIINSYCYNLPYDYNKIENDNIVMFSSYLDEVQKAATLLYNEKMKTISREDIENEDISLDANVVEKHAISLARQEDIPDNIMEFFSNSLSISKDNLIQMFIDYEAEVYPQIISDIKWEENQEGVKRTMKLFYAALDKSKELKASPKISMLNALYQVNGANVNLVINCRGKELVEKYELNSLVRIIQCGQTELSEYSFPTNKRGEEIYTELFGPRRERNWKEDRITINDIKAILYRNKPVWEA